MNLELRDYYVITIIFSTRKPLLVERTHIPTIVVGCVIKYDIGVVIEYSSEEVVTACVIAVTFPCTDTYYAVAHYKYPQVVVIIYDVLVTDDFYTSQNEA